MACQSDRRRTIPHESYEKSHVDRYPSHLSAGIPRAALPASFQSLRCRTLPRIHQLREQDNDDDEYEREKVAFEYPGLNTEEFLVEAAKTEPQAEERLDREQDLKVAHPLFGHGTENLREHEYPCPDRDEQRPRDDLAYVHHNGFAGFGRFVGTQGLFHPGHEEIVGKEKAAVDERGKEVNDMYECKCDGTTLRKK